MGRAKNRDSAARGNALLDLVRLDGMQTAKPAIEFGVFHDVEHVRVQDGMNDGQIQGDQSRSDGTFRWPHSI
jgi:hypothetical protein